MNEWTQIKIVHMEVTVTLEWGQQATYMTGVPVYFEWTSEHDATVYGCDPRPDNHITPCNVTIWHQALGAHRSQANEFLFYIADIYLKASIHGYKSKNTNKQAARRFPFLV